MNQMGGGAAARPANREMPLLLPAPVGATLLRIALAARIPLGADELYSLLWARPLAWGYPDHPPMIAAVIALGTRVFGDSPLAIRILPLLMASATPLLLYAAGRDIFDAAAGRRAALLLLGLPAYTLGATFAFPDAPLSLYAALGLWTGWRALRGGGWWWVATAAAAALALFSKVLAVFLLLGLLGMLIGGPWRAGPSSRRWFSGRRPRLGFFCASRARRGSRMCGGCPCACSTSPACSSSTTGCWPCRCWRALWSPCAGRANSRGGTCSG